MVDESKFTVEDGNTLKYDGSFADLPPCSICKNIEINSADHQHELKTYHHPYIMKPEPQTVDDIPEPVDPEDPVNDTM